MIDEMEYAAFLEKKVSNFEHSVMNDYEHGYADGMRAAAVDATLFADCIQGRWQQ